MQKCGAKVSFLFRFALLYFYLIDIFNLFYHNCICFFNYIFLFLFFIFIFAEVFIVSSETYCWHILKQESGNNCMRQISENIGLLSVYLGAILLVVGFFMEWTDSNVFLLVALFLVIAGAVTHVIMQKRHNKY